MPAAAAPTRNHRQVSLKQAEEKAERRTPIFEKDGKGILKMHLNRRSAISIDRKGREAGRKQFDILLETNPYVCDTRRDSRYGNGM